MPNASAPNAPCVDVWLSPQTIVQPGSVMPSSGPMTCTMPWLRLCMSKRLMPFSWQFFRQRLELRRGVESSSMRQSAVLGRNGVVHHREGQLRPAHFASRGFQSRKRLRRGDFVDQVAVNIDQRRLPGSSWTTCAFQIFS